ncbi:suppressor of fused domain protein [Deinococcus maricopensis]
MNRQTGIGGGSPMHSVYFTYPYENDLNIYITDPYGQILTLTARMQVFWVFPAHESEHQFIRQAGPDAVEVLGSERKPAVHDFRRALVV